MMSPNRDEALVIYDILRERLKSCLRRVLEIKRKRPHFVAALIMAAGCEAVGKLLDAIEGGKRQPHDVFVRELILPHQTLSSAMGRELFQSLRHGIAHSFWPKPIVLDDGTRLLVTVNWGIRPPHLGPRRDPPGIWVNLPTMKADFEAMLDKYRRHFEETSRPGREPSTRWQIESILPASKETNRAWHAFLETAEQDTADERQRGR